MIAKIDRDFIAADLSSVEGLLTKLTERDFVMRRSLETRRDELRKSLERATVVASERKLASVAIFFGGKPVVRNQGIESEFGANAIGTFQDIVSKVSAARGLTTLGQRGPVSDKDESKLHITNIVHGSFGFKLEEIGEEPLFESGLKGSVDDAAKIMASFDDATNYLSSDAMEEIDNRILETTRKFFALVYDHDATFRIVAGEVDKSYDRSSLERAIERARVTTIEESDSRFNGRLEGLLPGHRTFEYRTEEHGLLYGRIAKTIANQDITALLRDWYYRESAATVTVKKISRPGRDLHLVYSLLSISARRR